MSGSRFPFARGAGTVVLALVSFTLACHEPREPTAPAGLIDAGSARATAVAQLQMIGGTNGKAYAVNDRGEVVGQSCTTSCFGRAFYWSQTGGLVDLGTLPGFTRSVAFAINDNSAVFGKLECYVADIGCDSTYRSQLVRWDRVGGAWTITPLQGCSDFNPEDLPVNNSEQCVVRLVGQLAVQRLNGGAVVSTEPLPKLNAGDTESAFAISNAPMVAGVANGATSDPVIWYRDLAGGWRILKLTLPGTDNIGAALDIGDPGIAGRVRVSGRSAAQGGRGYRAVRWTLDPDGAGGYRVTSTEVLANAKAGRSTDAWGHAINEAGDVAGHSGFLPVVWPISGGVLTLPTANGGALKALDINDHGLVVGIAWDAQLRCERAAVWQLQ